MPTDGATYVCRTTPEVCFAGWTTACGLLLMVTKSSATSPSTTATEIAHAQNVTSIDPILPWRFGALRDGSGSSLRK